MLNDGSGFKKVYLATGFTDLRRGIDGLARIIRFQFQLDPYDKNTLFLFCGKRTDRIKGLMRNIIINTVLIQYGMAFLKNHAMRLYKKKFLKQRIN